MSQCLIVETSWYEGSVSDRLQRIPAGNAPSVIQPDRDTAEREALRLAREHPGKTFVVFDAVAAATSQKIPSHITLGGKVVREHIVPALSAIENDNDIPF